MPGKTVILDVMAFFCTMYAAWALNWSTTDLVWGLWLSSLTIGYVTILSAIIGGAYIGTRVIHHPEFPAQYRMMASIGGVVFATFMLGFFSFHFGAFHSGHAVFLSDFFPLEGIEPRAFSGTFMNPPALLEIAFTQLVPLYGLFVIPILIAERHYVFKGLTDAWQAFHDTTLDVAQSKQALRSGKMKQAMAGSFGQPYINVIRMHLLIFFFAFANSMNVDSFVMYVVVCLVYFFPWKMLKRPAITKTL